jgi:glycosyltransferase involved in cell wall biosynthesis
MAEDRAVRTVSQPLVSIVTPVYNEAGFLAECIESVLAQTYQNWEYTILDNFSTDGTLDVAQLYARRDPRIRVHRNDQLLDVIRNHNAALRLISPESKYCKVVFGDDWIFPTCLEQMVALAEAHPSVGIVGAYAVEGRKIAWSGLEYPSPVISGVEICRRHLLDALYVFGSANALLYRADLVRSRQHFYNEQNIHADTEVCFSLLKTCNFGFVHQILTGTRVRPVSMSAVTRGLQTDFGSMLQLLKVHAPEFLTPEECEIRLARHLSEYYRFLGKSLFAARSYVFWSYHRKQFQNAGLGFSYARIARGALEVVATAAVNPGATLMKLLRNRSWSPLFRPGRSRRENLMARHSESASDTL